MHLRQFYQLSRTPQGPSESIASKISTAIVDTTQGVTESVASQVTSVAGEAYNSAASYASDIIDDIPSVTDVVDDVTSRRIFCLLSRRRRSQLSSASNVASSTASIAGQGIVNVKDQAQIVFKVPESDVGEKMPLSE